MEMMKSEHPVTEMADALEVSASGYAGHRQKDQRPRRQEDRRLEAELVPIFEQSRRTYGSPRLHDALRKRGYRCGKNRVARLQKSLGLRPKQKRRWRPTTTKSERRLPVAENWLAKVPAADRPDQIWASDITYIETLEGWLYLAAILDLCSRRVAGWNVSQELTTPLVTGAWEKAWHQRQPAPGLLHHSDRGCQYASETYQGLLHKSGATASMSAAGNCYDNAAMESFWATLKTECFGDLVPPTKQQATLMIFDYIEAFYNRSRSHSSLEYKSPLEFESSINHNTK
jgi:putative transposase